MKLVQNATTKATVDIGSMKIFSIMPTQLHTGAPGFAAIVCTEPGVGFPVAEFTKLEDAQICMDKITRHFLGLHDNDMYKDKNDILIVEDKVEESLIQLPDQVKNNKSNTMNLIKK